MPENQLSWQPGFSLSRKPFKRPAVRRKRQQQFEFVEDHSQKSQDKKSPLTGRTVSPSNYSREYPSRASTLAPDSRSDNPEKCASSDDLSLEDWSASTSEGPFFSKENRQSSEGNSISYNTEHKSTPTSLALLVHYEGTLMSQVTGFWASTDNRSFIFSSLPATISFGSLTQRFKPILNRYNGEFCTIPLTFGLHINPFRYRTDIDPEPTFLVHAVMALAGHHVKSASTSSHRHSALRLLRQNLDIFEDAEAMYSMLDTIVILFSLDETQSMFGNWSTHLAGAYALLEACGGIHIFNMSSRLEAQIGILTWWDAIISLLSREDCVFPYEYFDAILSNQARREWDFFSLCGCPTSLAKIVMQIARLSASKQNQNRKGGFSFRTSIVNSNNTDMRASISDIEQELTIWCHTPAPAAFQDEESMHNDRDTMHCSEAWRHGLSLYIFRIFHWEPGASIPPYVIYIARVIVDHVTSCRDNEMISRQALFPLFLAGCELTDPSLRRKIVELCEKWDGRTRYHMFGDAVGLLEEVWERQEGIGGEEVWWGTVVDGRHKRTETDEDKACPLKMRLCFG
ncbi:hypothetical protein VTL71DRAFT_805 [Oculimacula yallundae]|uniref:Fungal-specific transcription factor domain-containing protein n=1 Tax=Oculimacula yallundae TaxID=86028 RepID=A0ABR4D142_9HELO